MMGSGSRAVGMGAMPDGERTAFRVWAPHARRVAVIGSFNGWDGGRDPMESEGDGCWYAEVAGARPGHEYLYLLETPAGELSRIDPRAREVTDSAGNGVIHDPAAFDWGPDDFRMPPATAWSSTSCTSAPSTTRAARTGGPARSGPPSSSSTTWGSWGSTPSRSCRSSSSPAAGPGATRPSQIFAVESSYGGPSALKALVKECHRRGIAVILDVVYNHLGPQDVHLWRFDGWSENDLGGIYFFNDWRAETPWGHSRPDYTRAEVRRFLVNNAMMWLDEYRVDGLRVDGTVFIRTADFSGDKADPRGLHPAPGDQRRGAPTVPRPAPDRRGPAREPRDDPSGGGRRRRLRHPVGRQVRLRDPEGGHHARSTRSGR